MNKLRLFDVSLRDGLQTFKNVLPLKEKIILLESILFQHKPQDIEIGSFVSPKVLPQFQDTGDLLNHINKKNYKNNFWVLVPNLKGLDNAINMNVKNLSFISSVSNDFQKKNIKKTLSETKNELDKMVYKAKNKNIKIYVSCINHCPIYGKIDNDFIIDELKYYNKYENLKNLCLSDTCGNLSFDDFKYIINKLDKLDNLSLHLHVSNEENTKKILKYAIEKGIKKFDVSCLENSGGCSVTIDNSNLNENLNYNLIKKLF